MNHKLVLEVLNVKVKKQGTWFVTMTRCETSDKSWFSRRGMFSLAGLFTNCDILRAIDVEIYNIFAITNYHARARAHIHLAQKPAKVSIVLDYGFRTASSFFERALFILFSISTDSTWKFNSTVTRFISALLRLYVHATLKTKGRRWHAIKGLKKLLHRTLSRYDTIDPT